MSIVNRRVARTMFGMLAIAVLGMAPPGCWKPPLHPPGRFCASPSNGGEFCVGADRGAAAAWDEAAGHGPQPIQMWSEWPAEVDLDDLVASQDELRTWFEGIDSVLSHVRDVRHAAESYRVTMAGEQRSLLAQAIDRQTQLLADKPDPIGTFKADLIAKAAEENDPLAAELAADKQTMGEVEALIQKAKTDGAPLATAYAALVGQFVAYRDTEPSETQGYASLSQQASSASLANLGAVEQAIVSTAQSASSQPSALAMSAIQLSAQIQAFETAMGKALAPHEAFFATHGAAMPDMTSSSLRSVHAMLGYVKQRVARSDATATMLLAGCAMRRKALEMLAAPPPPDASGVMAGAKLRRTWLDAARADVEARRENRSTTEAR